MPKVFIGVLITAWVLFAWTPFAVAQSTSQNKSNPKQLGLYEVVGASEGSNSIEVMEISDSGLKQAFAEDGVSAGTDAYGVAYIERRSTVQLTQSEPLSGYVLQFGAGSQSWEAQSVRQQAFAMGVMVDVPVESMWVWQWEGGLGTGNRGLGGADRFSMGSSFLWLPLENSSVEPYLGLGLLSWFEQSRTAGRFSGSGWSFGGQGVAGLRFWVNRSLSLGLRTVVVMPWMESNSVQSGTGWDYQVLGTMGLAL